MKNKLICIITCLMITIPVIAEATNVRDYINDQACDQILDKGYYEICYDYKMKSARYVSYTLDGTKVNAINIKKRPRFYPDRSIPRKYRTKSSDYTRNEYRADRGHLAPDADFDNSKMSLNSVYSMANIIPQYFKINRGRNEWAGAERYERKVASKLGSVGVINGVIYGKNPQRLRRSGIAYPYAYWKMIYNDQIGFKKCLYFENEKPKNLKRDKLKYHVVNCSTIRSGRQ